MIPDGNSFSDILTRHSFRKMGFTPADYVEGGLPETLEVMNHLKVPANVVNDYGYQGLKSIPVIGHWGRRSANIPAKEYALSRPQQIQEMYFTTHPQYRGRAKKVPYTTYMDQDLLNPYLRGPLPDINPEIFDVDFAKDEKGNPRNPTQARKDFLEAIGQNEPPQFIKVNGFIYTWNEDRNRYNQLLIGVDKNGKVHLEQLTPKQTRHFTSIIDKPLNLGSIIREYHGYMKRGEEPEEEEDQDSVFRGQASDIATHYNAALRDRILSKYDEDEIANGYAQKDLDDFLKTVNSKFRVWEPKDPSNEEPPTDEEGGQRYTELHEFFPDLADAVGRRIADKYVRLTTPDGRSPEDGRFLRDFYDEKNPGRSAMDNLVDSLLDKIGSEVIVDEQGNRIQPDLSPELISTVRGNPGMYHRLKKDALESAAFDLFKHHNASVQDVADFVTANVMNSPRQKVKYSDPTYVKNIPEYGMPYTKLQAPSMEMMQDNRLTIGDNPTLLKGYKLLEEARKQINGMQNGDIPYHPAKMDAALHVLKRMGRYVYGSKENVDKLFEKERFTNVPDYEWYDTQGPKDGSWPGKDKKEKMPYGFTGGNVARGILDIISHRARDMNDDPYVLHGFENFLDDMEGYSRAQDDKDGPPLDARTKHMADLYNSAMVREFLTGEEEKLTSQQVFNRGENAEKEPGASPVPRAAKAKKVYTGTWDFISDPDLAFRTIMAFGDENPYKDPPEGTTNTEKLVTDDIRRMYGLEENKTGLDAAQKRYDKAMAKTSEGKMGRGEMTVKLKDHISQRNSNTNRKEGHMEKKNQDIESMIKSKSEQNWAKKGLPSGVVEKTMPAFYRTVTVGEGKDAINVYDREVLPKTMEDGKVKKVKVGPKISKAEDSGEELTLESEAPFDPKDLNEARVNLLDHALNEDGEYPDYPFVPELETLNKRTESASEGPKKIHDATKLRYTRKSEEVPFRELMARTYFGKTGRVIDVEFLDEYASVRKAANEASFDEMARGFSNANRRKEVRDMIGDDMDDIQYAGLTQNLMSGDATTRAEKEAYDTYEDKMNKPYRQALSSVANNVGSKIADVVDGASRATQDEDSPMKYIRQHPQRMAQLATDSLTAYGMPPTPQNDDLYKAIDGVVASHLSGISDEERAKYAKDLYGLYNMKFQNNYFDRVRKLMNEYGGVPEILADWMRFEDPHGRSRLVHEANVPDLRNFDDANPGQYPVHEQKDVKDINEAKRKPKKGPSKKTTGKQSTIEDGAANNLIKQIKDGTVGTPEQLYAALRSLNISAPEREWADNEYESD